MDWETWVIAEKGMKSPELDMRLYSTDHHRFKEDG